MDMIGWGVVGRGWGLAEAEGAAPSADGRVPGGGMEMSAGKGVLLEEARQGRRDRGRCRALGS